MKKAPLWNSVIPVNIYVVLDASGRFLCEQQANYAHEALELAKVDWGQEARTVIEKKQWKKMEELQGKWLKSARRVEA